MLKRILLFVVILGAYVGLGMLNYTLSGPAGY